MPTLSDLRGYMRDWLGTSSTRLSDNTATQILNIAQREILRTRDLWFAETSVTLPIVSGTNNYQFPTTAPAFERVFAIYYPDPSDTSDMFRMQEISFEEFQKKYGSVANMSSGDPIEYAMYGNYIYFGPTPDGSFDSYLFYYGRFADLSAVGDTNNLTVYGWEALLFHALAYTCKYMLEDERAPMFEALAKKHLDDLITSHVRNKIAGRGYLQLQEPT